MQELSESIHNLGGAVSTKLCSSAMKNNFQPLPLSRGNTPEPLYPNVFEHMRHRQRNWSGASNGSERSTDELDPMLWNQENAALHPRIRRLSGNRRRSMPPDPASLLQQGHLYNRHEAWNRSFSEQTQNSRGTTPDPYENPENMFTE